MTLRRAQEFVKSGKYERALDALIETWRKGRAPAIAHAIDAVDKARAAPAFEGSVTKWTTEARKAEEASTRGPLIRALASMTMGDLLTPLTVALKWDDPRVGTVVLELLRELRFSGKRSQVFWGAVLDTVPAQRDPRFLELETAAPDVWKVGDMQAYLMKRLQKNLDGLAPVTLEAEDQKTVDEILALLQPRRAPVQATKKTGESLLADIYANPHDDEPRLVYSDWLSERGDPRGELIALQLRAGANTDKTAKKRETELLKAHKKEWLGPLAPVVGSDATFRRGFLATATVKLKHQKDAEQFMSLPDWATVEDLRWSDNRVPHDQEEWARFIGRAQRFVKAAYGPSPKRLLEGDTVWALEHLGLLSSTMPSGSTDGPIWRAIASARARFPKLQRLYVMGSSTPDWLDGVTVCPPHIQMRGALDRDARDAWLAAAEKTALETLTFDLTGNTGLGPQHHFTRDATGKLTRLRSVLRSHEKLKTLDDLARPYPRVLDDAIVELAALGKGSLTHYEALIEIGGALVPCEPAHEAAAHALR